MLESDEQVGPIPVRQRKFRHPFTSDELLRLRTLFSMSYPTYKIMLREGCRQSVIILAQEGYRFRWRDVHAIKELADSSRRPGKSSRRPGDLPRRPVDPSTPLWHAFNALHYARLTREAYPD